MRYQCIAFLAVASVIAVVQDVSGAEQNGKQPNILFILADDAGYGDFGFTGHPYARTPALDKLAGQGAFFKNFYVSGPVCSPSRTGLMTAAFPRRSRRCRQPTVSAAPSLSPTS